MTSSIMPDGEHTAVYHLPAGRTCETKEEVAEYIVGEVVARTGAGQDDTALIDESVYWGFVGALGATEE